MEVLQVVWSLLGFLLAVSLLAFGLYCFYIKTVHWRYDHIPGAPRASFFFGHMPVVWESLKSKKLVHNIFLQWAEEYGPVLRFNAFHRVSLLIVSPEAVKEYLMLPQYPKDRITYGYLFNMFGVRFLGNSLVTEPDYDHWHKQRRIMDPAFSRTYLLGLMGTFNDQAEELMKELQKKADGETQVDVMNLLGRVTLDIIAKVAFGIELNTLHNDQTPFPHAVNLVMRGLGKGRNPFFKLNQILHPSGHESTASLLSFTIMELGRHPEIVAKLQAEVDEVIGVKTDIAYEDLGKLEYLSQVLKEVLRLYPLAPRTVRWTGTENIIEGVKIPANTTLIFSSYVMGRMERYFKDPLTFNPDRFSKDEPRPYFCYFPFSLGPRSCIGQVFALMEAKVVMAKFLQRFEFQLVPPQSFRIWDLVTLRPADDVVCRLKARCH
uniref:Cholesterol 24-hydroxylase-like n=1 Tax=Pogona vitticeps TaxID=103695 RepID=A0ABM5FQK0_9SAUR